MEASVLFSIIPPSGFPGVDPTPVPKEARADLEGGPTGVVLAPWVETGLGQGHLQWTLWETQVPAAAGCPQSPAHSW